ncbi:hypothetical protein G3A_14190 [Bacillus sp. 17376]|nr:hypothetical protein G3A_14190 [Bacillus sp. 17376]
MGLNEYLFKQPLQWGGGNYIHFTSKNRTLNDFIP